MTLVAWVLAAVCLIGAVAVVFAHGMTRMVLGLAAFLIGVAGYFLLYGMALLAAVQVFVYVGGVLVLVLFAIMVVRRDAGGRPGLTNRHDLSSMIVSVGLFALMQRTLAPGAPALEDVVRTEDALAGLSDTLLGPMLPHFETIGVVLLIALVAAVAVMTQGGERG